VKNEELRHVGNTYDIVYSKAHPPIIGQFLLQKSEVRLSCKTTFQEERTNQLNVQNYTTHIDTKTQLKVAFHSGVGFLIYPHMRDVCIIDTVAIELCFVSKQDVTMQLATAIKPLAKFQPLSKIASSEMLHSLHVVWIHALCMQCSPHCRVGTRRRLTILRALARGLFFTIWTMPSSSSTLSLTSRSAALRMPGSVPVSRNVL